MARKVMVVGCGRVGAMVARELVARGDDVTVIDLDAENFRRLSEGDTLHLYVGDGTSNDDLRKGGIEKCDAFICVTRQDTVNALAGQTAQFTFGVKTVVCRINDPVRRTMYDSMGLRTFSPPEVMTKLVLEALDR
jgi:trk system potassium uptake protein TrkA